MRFASKEYRTEAKPQPSIMWKLCRAKTDVRAAIRNRRSAIWNIVNPISLSILSAGIDNDIEKTIFQIADRRLRIADSLSSCFPKALAPRHARIACRGRRVVFPAGRSEQLHE